MKQTLKAMWPYLKTAVFAIIAIIAIITFVTDIILIVTGQP